MLAVYSQLAVVALQIRTTRLHEMAAWIGEIPLTLGGGCPVRLPCQSAPGH